MWNVSFRAFDPNVHGTIMPLTFCGHSSDCVHMVLLLIGLETELALKLQVIYFVHRGVIMITS